MFYTFLDEKEMLIIKCTQYFMILNTQFTETNLMTFVLTLVYNCAIYVKFTLA